MNETENPDPLWHSIWYEMTYVTFMTTLTLGFRLRLINQRFMPKTGPVLVIANHQSFFDPVMCCLCTRRQLVPMARKTLFRNPFFSALIRSYKAIPIDQEGVGKEGIRAISERLKLGQAVLVFPEGERCSDGKMAPFKAGIHLLLKKAPAPIIPLGIAGAFDAWPRQRKFPLPAPLFLPACSRSITLALGEPLESQRYAEMPRDQAMQELYDKVHDAQLVAEQHRRR